MCKFSDDEAALSAADEEGQGIGVTDRTASAVGTIAEERVGSQSSREKPNIDETVVEDEEDLQIVDAEDDDEEEPNNDEKGIF